MRDNRKAELQHMIRTQMTGAGEKKGPTGETTEWSEHMQMGLGQRVDSTSQLGLSAAIETGQSEMRLVAVQHQAGHSEAKDEHFKSDKRQFT